jgi:hypothetical protein
MRLLTVLAALLAALAALAIPAVASADTTAEGETFTWTPSTAAQVQTDSAASGGSTLDLAGNSTASKTVTTTAASDSIVLHVRNTLCSGESNLAVTVDGTAVGTTTGSSSTYRDITYAGTWPAGSHTVQIVHQNDLWTSSTCDRNYFLDKVTFHSTPVTPPATTIFDGNFQSGSLAAYPTSVHPNRATIVNDPAGVEVGGVTRKVVKFDVFNTDTGPTNNPRSQLESPRFWDQGETYYLGRSDYFPSPGFPTMTQSSHWLNVGDIYGPPFTDTAPFTLMVEHETGTTEFAQIIQGSYNTRFFPWRISPIQSNHWYDTVCRVKLDTVANGGGSECWGNSGTGWVRRSAWRNFATWTPANNQGANYTKISHYRVLGMASEGVSYVGWHRVATDFQTSAPTSYGPAPATPPA